MRIDTITPALVDTCGGNLVTLGGTFEQNTAYCVVCIPSANPVQPQLSNAHRFAPRAVIGKFGENFPLSYSGVPGNGVFCYSLDGETLQFVAPQNPPGPLNVIVYDQATGENTYAFGYEPLTAVPPFISSMTFALRSVLPLNYAAGPRNVSAIAVPSADAQVAI